MKPTPQIKQRIQELVPDIMELKFGCHIEQMVDDGICEVCTIIERGLNNNYKLQVPERADMWMGGNCLDKILGRPITLADVLRAVDNCKNSWEIKVYANGTIESSSSWGETKWNLSTDFDGQTDECKQFIGELLGVNK